MKIEFCFTGVFGIGYFKQSFEFIFFKVQIDNLMFPFFRISIINISYK